MHRVLLKRTLCSKNLPNLKYLYKIIKRFLFEEISEINATIYFVDDYDKAKWKSDEFISMHICKYTNLPNRNFLEHLELNMVRDI